MSRGWKLALGLAMACSASNGWSEESLLDSQTRTAYMFVRYGPSTYKSKVMEANDTAYAMNYEIGANVGEEKHLGILMRTDQSTIPFEIPSSSLASVWKDTIIRYRLGFLYLGVDMGNVDMVGNQGGTDVFTVTGSGFGANAGILIPLSKLSRLYLDFTSVTMSKVVEKDQKEFTYGPRTDIDLGSSIGITKQVLSFLCGYRMRTYSVTYLGTSYAEAHTMTYVGFQLGVDF